MGADSGRGWQGDKVCTARAVSQPGACDFSAGFRPDQGENLMEHPLFGRAPCALLKQDAAILFHYTVPPQMQPDD